MKLFKKILIANRGEIAVRVIRSAREMGIKTVAVYSKPDAEALHVLMADESYYLGEQELSDTYLNVGKIIDIAKQSGSDAIHPGYGFLAENPDIVNACEKEGIAFIGPSLRAIQLMGNKVEARAFVTDLGTPMTKGAVGTHAELIEAAKIIPLPILVKAAAGGGGKGMRIVHDLKDLQETIEATSREAKAYFGDEEVFIEQYILEPRHIEIQIIGDKHGNVVHLYERECSIQRRYQKIIEESPSPTLDQSTREKMGAAAVDIAKAIDYDNAGTIEFLVDKNLDFYFLEMNTRVQVEHPVTEMVTGIDIVREQILVAAGNKLGFKQSDISQTGHAIEARIYAEDPENDFRPAPGDIIYYEEPEGVGIRVDSGIDRATTIHSFFDPMVSKLICYSDNREDSIAKLDIALQEFIVHGIKNNIPYLIEMLNHKAFTENKISTKFCDERTDEILNAIQASKDAVEIENLAVAYLIHDMNSRKVEKTNVWNKIGYWRIAMDIVLRMGEQEFKVKVNKVENNIYDLEINGKPILAEHKYQEENYIELNINHKPYSLFISLDEYGINHLSYKGNIYEFSRADHLVNTDIYISEADEAGGNSIKSPMPGKVIKLNVKAGDKVSKGDSLIVVEAMKMENSLTVHRDAVIEEVKVSEGEMVDNSQVLITLVEEEEL
ncbi:MAG: methylcrotonoyl-CoA carboxylase [Bacteroidetes bacterium]|nr:MAG: methylcrotonoyl-CoA carboxylase [Bacteroidota bacterium]